MIHTVALWYLVRGQSSQSSQREKEHNIDVEEKKNTSTHRKVNISYDTYNSSMVHCRIDKNTMKNIILKY